MKPILKIKIAVDAAMSVFMLLLMAYGLVGEAAHEWIGMGMFVLFVATPYFEPPVDSRQCRRDTIRPCGIVQTALASG